MSLLLGMNDQVASVLWVQGHHDVEEVGPVHHPSLGLLVWQIAPELRVLHHFRIEVLDRKFVVEWNIYPLDFRHLEESLFLNENLLQEILVDANLRWNVELAKGIVREERCILTDAP